MSLLAAKTYARPYADAAYQIAKQKNALPSWQAFLMTMADVFAQKQIMLLLRNPLVDQMVLLSNLQDTLSKEFAAEQMNFLLLLAEKKRLMYLPAIHLLFDALVDQNQGMARVCVKTAYELDATSKQALQNKLEARFKKQIVMETLVNPELIGGLIVQLEDFVLDASVKGRLAELNQNL